jgi:RNA polymerase sigma-70 factor, ECF subfamily
MTAVVAPPSLDRSAFTDLLRRHDAAMRGLAYKLLGGDRDRMDDVLQDAYLKAFRSLGSFRADADFATWLYRIVHNACIDDLRRAKPVVPLSVLADTPSTAAGPERRAAAADAVQRALNALNTDQRAAVLLVDGEGLDLQAAADVLGVPTGTVASRVSRARAAMRASLGGNLDD